VRECVPDAGKGAAVLAGGGKQQKARSYPSLVFLSFSNSSPRASSMHSVNTPLQRGCPSWGAASLPTSPSLRAGYADADRGSRRPTGTTDHNRPAPAGTPRRNKKSPHARAARRARRAHAVAARGLVVVAARHED
jgi:hypothetical protein